MTQEEKAKAYDEALERAKECHIDGLSLHQPVKDVIEHIFPELSESEDDRIRKWLIGYFQRNKIAENIKTHDILAWLEKQGEQKTTDNEPKFKVGDILVSEEEDRRHIYKVEAITNYGTYLLLDLEDGYTRNESVYICDLAMYLWSIQDAKDGDVLSYRDGQWIFIYKGKIDDSSFYYHTLYSTIHQDLTINDAGFTLLGDAILPATKEQRDLLFSKMKEAGYEWDEEKKELRKIEQKSAWSEEDEKMFNYALDMIEWYSGKNEDKSRLISNWLKSLKDRYTWKPSDEQLEAIRLARTFVTDDFGENPTLSELLIELEEQLKKLKG